VERVRPLRRLAFVVRTTNQPIADSDSLDDQDLIDNVDLALRLGAQAPITGVDPARLQRASQGAGQSTGGGGHHIVESRRVVGILSWSGAVVLADLVVGPEHDRLGFRR
jgi:hypothetical protein